MASSGGGTLAGVVGVRGGHTNRIAKKIPDLLLDLPPHVDTHHESEPPRASSIEHGSCHKAVAPESHLLLPDPSTIVLLFGGPTALSLHGHACAGHAASSSVASSRGLCGL